MKARTCEHIQWRTKAPYYTHLNNQIDWIYVGKKTTWGSVAGIKTLSFVPLVVGKHICLQGSSWPTAVEADCSVSFRME